VFPVQLLALVVLEFALTAALAALSARAALGLESRTLRLLAASFGLLALSSALKIAWLILSSEIALALSSAVMAVSFFVLAISHVYSVSPRASASYMLLLMLPTPVLAAYTLAKGVSLYLVLYAAVETTIFYTENRYRASLLTATGLYVLFASLVLGFTSLGIANLLIVEAVQAAGYALLLASGVYSYRGAEGGG
jgi:hypothetical protein